MPWFKVSDDWATHPKTIAAGKDGRSLWFTSGDLMAKASTDGRIAKDQHKLYSALAEVPWKRNSEKLVEVRFWHPEGDLLSGCTDCQIDIENIRRHRRDNDLPALDIGTGDLYWHAWAFHQLPKHRQQSPEARAADDRDRALRKDTGLCQEIQKRDGSLCRFCGIRVEWRHRRGRHRATYEHLNPRCFSPAGGNFLEAVVTACGPCNEAKNARTVDEWVADGGKTLKPAGWRAGAPDPTAAAIWPGSNPDLIPPPNISDSGLDSSYTHGRPDARPGSGQIGSGPGLGPGPGGAGPARLGLGRDGPGWAGMVRGGSAEGAQPSPTTEVRGADPDHRDQTAQHHEGAPHHG